MSMGVDEISPELVIIEAGCEDTWEFITMFPVFTWTC